VLGPIAAAAVLPLDAFFSDFEFRRLFNSLSSAEIADLVARAKAERPDYAPPRFENFAQVFCSVGFDPQPLIAFLLQLQGIVEAAYLMPRTEHAGVVAVTNPKFGLQKYLLRAPVGIGVQSAWAKGADGTGRKLVDVEHAWLLNRKGDDRHEDLPQNIPLLAGLNRLEERGHGAAVLGVIAAVDNGIGVVGIAPKVGISVISPQDPLSRPDAQPTEDLANNILSFTQSLGRGDVLLLELTVTPNLPVELDLAVFKAVEVLSSRGVVVVEAAGNGGVDLDGLPFHGDSGAIVVGACTADPSHVRVPNPKGSNFGSRIDCNAWGEKVHTCGSKTDPVPFNRYFDFSGTSSAAAIVAGLCLLVEQLQEKKTGTTMSGMALRNILRDPNNCTVSPTFFVDRIGHMPDLQKIITNLAL